MTLHRPLREVEIQTASLADVAFLLVVFFLVTAVFAETRGLEYRVPDRSDDPPPASPVEKALHVRIEDGGRVLLAGLAVDAGELDAAVVPAVLASLRVAPGRPVLVTATADAPSGTLVGVLDALGLAERAAREQGLLAPSGRLRVVVPSLAEIRALEARFGADAFR
jgi:biopolymer transport protein ExbD